MNWELRDEGWLWCNDLWYEDFLRVFVAFNGKATVWVGNQAPFMRRYDHWSEAKADFERAL